MVDVKMGIVGPLKVRYKGVFDLNGLLAMTYRWFMDNQYEYEEPTYKDKVESPFGNETEVKMKGSRKVTEYYQNEVVVAIHCWESREIVVKAGSREVKMLQGRLEVTVEGAIIRDWQKRFQGAFWEKAQKFMDNVVLKNEFLAKYAGTMDSEIHALNSDIKRFLKIEAV